MEPLLETWRINARLNEYLLAAVSDDNLGVRAAKGKAVAGNFSHIHNVRLMWLKVALPSAMEGLDKLEDTAGRTELEAGLKSSASAIEALLASAGDPAGKIKGFKPHAAAFVGYLIAHEANHRAQIDFILRLNGTPVDDKTHYGLWEWGVR